MQVENGLVETVAVLISKMPRLRPSLPPGSPGQAHSFKPEFSRVRWSSTLSAMSAGCVFSLNIHLFLRHLLAMERRCTHQKTGVDIGMGEMAQLYCKAGWEHVLGRVQSSGNAPGFKEAPKSGSGKYRGFVRSHCPLDGASGCSFTTCSTFLEGSSL